MPKGFSSFNLDEDKNNNLVIIIGNPNNQQLNIQSCKKIVVDFLKSRENFSQTKDKSENKSTGLENKSDKQTIELAQKLGLENGSNKRKKDLRQDGASPKVANPKTIKTSKRQNKNANKSANVLKLEEKSETLSAEPNNLVKGLSINQNFLSDPKWRINSPTNTASSSAISGTKKGKISIELSKTNNVSSMRFGWSENVPAAVFTRAGYLWVAFDQEVSLDVSNLKSESLQIISLPQQIDSDKGPY